MPFIILVIVVFAYSQSLLSYAAESKSVSHKNLQAIKLQAEKAISAKGRIILHGQIDMLSFACKEAGITLSSTHLPATVKNVITGSSAYYADIKAEDKIVATDFKNNRFCISLERAGKPYYTEIRLSAQALGSPTLAKPASAPAEDSQPRNAIGFRFTMGTGEVTYIDPNSDLFGKIKEGDIFVSLTNNPPGLPSTNSNNEAIIYPIFKHNGICRYYPCREKTIESFARQMTESLRQEGYGAATSPFANGQRH